MSYPVTPSINIEKSVNNLPDTTCTVREGENIIFTPSKLNGTLELPLSKIIGTGDDIDTEKYFLFKNPQDINGIASLVLQYREYSVTAKIQEPSGEYTTLGTYTKESNGAAWTYYGEAQVDPVLNKKGQWSVQLILTKEYRCTWTNSLEGTSYVDYQTYTATVTYIFWVTQNALPQKKWTITEVVTRYLELLEPLHKGENPRFRLEGVNYNNNGNVTGYTTGSQAEKFDQILAPEFSMTKQTAREGLRQIGGYLHAEPRLKANGIIYFDEYGKGELAKISERRHTAMKLSLSVDDFCTSLDSQAENLAFLFAQKSRTKIVRLFHLFSYLIVFYLVVFIRFINEFYHFIEIAFV